LKAPRLFDRFYSTANGSLCPFRDRPVCSMDCPPWAS
jgi:hypothetical protein